MYKSVISSKSAIWYNINVQKHKNVKLQNYF